MYICMCVHICIYVCVWYVCIYIIYIHTQLWDRVSLCSPGYLRTLCIAEQWWLVTPKVQAPLLHQQILQAGYHWPRTRVCSWNDDCTSPSVACRVSLSTTSVSQWGWSLWLGTSSACPCLVSDVECCLHRRALPSVCEEQPVTWNIGAFPWCRI